MSRPARIYVVLIMTAAALSVMLGCWLAPPGHYGVMIAAAVVAAAATPFTIPLPLLGNISLAFAWVLATLMLYGTLSASVAAAAVGVTGCFCGRLPWRPAHRAALTIGGPFVVAGLAGLFYHLAGGRSGSIEPRTDWPAIVYVAVTFLAGSTALTAGADLCSTGRVAFGRWREALRGALPDFAVATPLGVILAAGTAEYGLRILPFSFIILYILHFCLKLYSDDLRQRRRHGQEMADLYLSVIEALALAIDAKDRTTERHLRRVQTFAVEMGRLMRISESELEALRAGAVLHDIGKLAVPEYILCKPGRLNADEFEKMAIHSRVGAEILERVQFPYPVARVVRSHHEKFDGTGYPDRLAGEEIPLAARILAVVDCFDALTSDRPHRRPLSRDDAVEQIRSESGTSFDPRIVDLLVRNLDRMEGMVSSIPPASEVGTMPVPLPPSSEGDRTDGRRSLLSASIMENISSAHREGFDLYEIAQGMAGSLHLDEALSSIAGKIGRLIHHECLVVYLFEKDRRVLRARFAHGSGAAAIGRHEIPLGERTSGWAALHGLPISSHAPPQPSPRNSPPSDLEELIAAGKVEPFESALAAPLLDGEDLLGVLTLYDRPDAPFEPDNLRMISIVARHIGSGVKNALLYEQTQENALTDSLTRLPNARYLFASFEQEINRACRQQGPLSIIVLDVNNFKEVNDRFGHPAGDRVLRGVARAIRSQMRACDTCVRYAGDEFIMTVPGVGRDEIGNVQKRIETAIDHHKFAVTRDRALNVTVSMGSASYPDDGQSIEALIAVADAQMYAHKFAQRDRQAGPEVYQRFSGRRDVGVN